MAKKFDFDLIIIGSGAAGMAAAFAAAGTGLRVAVAEVARTWGGRGLNTRDIPFRAATSFSHLYHQAAQGARFGISSNNLRFNYPTLLNWQKLAKRRATTEVRKSFEEAGIVCLNGLAHFLSPYELSVGRKCVTAPKFLIAAGSKMDYGGIIGVENVECLTPETALKIPRPPETLLIVGGGKTGCEFAEYFATLGTKVCVMEVTDRLLAREDEEVGITFGDYLEQNLKVKILTQTRVTSVSNGENYIRASFIRGGEEKNKKFDTVLLATGRQPNLDLGLENAGIKFNKNRIVVNEYLQTSMKHIFAAGDCIGGVGSTERASYEGAVAIANMISRQKNPANRAGFIRLVNTFPQIAAVGMTEKMCLARRLKYMKVIVSLDAVSAANTEDFRAGFLKLIADGRKKIIGAVVMCPNAELVIEEITLAIRNNISAEQLASTPHISSSWSELVRLAAKEIAVSHKN